MKNSYFKQIWDSRYFWIHLALSDLKARWRYSFFGLLWSVIQPLGMTLILSFVFSRLFNVDTTRYVPYILSGMVVWDCIMATVINGSLSFLHAVHYIKQYKNPLAIYALRTVISATLISMLASIPLLIWTLIIMPENFTFSWISLLSLYPILILGCWPTATLLAYIGTRFRDLAPLLSLIMQALWFISPIYFEEKMFRNANLGWLIDYNPIYHILRILRAPILDGVFPSFYNYLVCFLTIILITIVTIVVGIHSEKKVIFYL